MISGVVSNKEMTANIVVIMGAYLVNEVYYVNQSIITSAALETDKL